MNTLGKNITPLFFKEELRSEAYEAIQRRWSEIVNSDERKTLTPAHHLLYAVVRGKDWRKGFTPITNKRKLDNGGEGEWGLYKALRRLSYSAATCSIFSEYLSDDAWKWITRLVNTNMTKLDEPAYDDSWVQALLEEKLVA